CILVRSLTAESRGNAVGVGLADIITAGLLRDIDFNALACNAVTSTFLERGKIPLVAPNDHTAIRWGLQIAKNDEPPRARILRIRDTMHLETSLAPQALVPELQRREGIGCGN